MRTTTILFLLSSLTATLAQLNYEGNPLTEDTVYTAEESHFTEKKANARSLEVPQTETAYVYASKNDLFKVDVPKVEGRGSSQTPANYENRVSPVYRGDANDPSTNVGQPRANEAYNKMAASSGEKMAAGYDNKMAAGYDNKMAVGQAVQYQVSDSPQSALATFLNSQTPAESQTALDALLGEQKFGQVSTTPPESGANGGVDPQTYQYGVTGQESYQPKISDIVLPGLQQQFYDEHLTTARASEYAQELYPDYTIQQKVVLAPRIPQNYVGYPKRNGNYLQQPIYNRYAAGKPFYNLSYRPQARIVSPSLVRRKGSFVPQVSADGPEIIYTKPISYQKVYGNEPKIPYDVVGSWYPDGNRPPPSTNIYQSQLYAQSYDPNYYNYIAKYGKIRPDLYGKLPPQDNGIMWELYDSFKKHGIKHITHPMFLMGFGIPIITLMLSALIQKRSAGRSMSSGEATNLTDEQLDEYIQLLKRSLECYRGDREKC